MHLLFATPLGLAASLRPVGFVSGAVSFVRRTLARKAFLGVQLGVLRCKSVSRQELSREYLLAKIGFDTVENGPLKVCQKLAKS